MCPWMKDIYGFKMDEMYFKCGQQMLFLRKNEQKKVETIYVGFFQKKSTNEMFKSQFKTIHISLI
jgi:hypothetical protein